MPISFTTKSNGGLERLISDLETRSTQALNPIGEETKREIISRTRAGRNVDGAGFESYSERYARRKGTSANQVNLQLTGDMLNSIISRVQQNELIISIQGSFARSKASWHQFGAGNNKVRRFFGLSDTQKRKIFQDFTRFLKR